MRRRPSATALVLLRELVARWVPEAGGVPVVRGPGKPRLDHPGVDHSISRSGGLVLAGLSRGWLVGLDVQRVEARWDVDGMAPLVLHPREAERLRSGPGTLQERFAEAWARKEAVVKLTGEGVGPRTPLLDTTTSVAGPDGSVLHLSSALSGSHAIAVATAPIPRSGLRRGTLDQRGASAATVAAGGAARPSRR